MKLTLFTNKNIYNIIIRFLIVQIFVLSLFLRSESVNAQSKNMENRKTDQKAESDIIKLKLPEKNLEPVFDNPTIYCEGVSDTFACPSEPTLRDAAIENMLTTRYASTPCFSFLDFDDIPWRTGGCINEKMGFFVHKLTFPAGTIENASLEIRCKAASKSETTYDYISFFQGTNYLASAFFKDLPGAGGTWNNNQQATFTLDLTNLPTLPGFDYTNILQYLQDGDLDVVIGTETGVDYMCLDLTKSLTVSVKFSWQTRLTPDTLRAYFRQAVSPYNIVDSQTVYPAVLASTMITGLNFSNPTNEDIKNKKSNEYPEFDTRIDMIYNKQENSNSDLPVPQFIAILSLPKLFEGNSYYLVMKSRNSIETWSAEPITILGSFTNYDFTISTSQAYGSNMIMVGGVASIYQGDIDQDGLIDLNDVLMVFNDATSFVTGYVNTDLNGDNIVDLSDLVTDFNNSSSFVSVARP